MNFAWGERGRTSYEKASQRTRYMASDYLGNRPPHYTPISCFQVASHKKYPIYWTAHESYVVVKTGKCLYLLTTAQLRAVVGDWPSWKPNPSLADRTFQIDTFPNLWMDDPSTTEWVDFTPYRYANLTDVYCAIHRSCLPCTVSSRHIHRMLPRPVNPQPRYAFNAIPDEATANPATPSAVSVYQVSANRVKSRRGERKKARTQAEDRTLHPNSGSSSIAPLESP